MIDRVYAIRGLVFVVGDLSIAANRNISSTNGKTGTRAIARRTYYAAVKVSLMEFRVVFIGLLPGLPVCVLASIGEFTGVNVEQRDSSNESEKLLKKF